MFAVNDLGVAPVAEELGGRVLPLQTFQVPLKKFSVVAARQDDVRLHPVTGQP